MKKILYFFLILIFILFVSLKSQLSYSQPQYDELRRNIENKLIIEYKLVNSLNKNNVDVSQYINLLNLSLDLLEKAGKYNSIGEDQNAISTLQLTISILNKVDNDVKNILIEYNSMGYLDTISSLIMPIVATIMVSILTISFWIIYKKYYFTKLMKMKPEVNKNEIK